MAKIVVKKQSAASVATPLADELALFVDIADSLLKTKDDGDVVRPASVGTADELATSGAPVDVSAGAPPTAGQVLTASGPTDAAFADAPLSTPVAQSAVIAVGDSPYAASAGELVGASLNTGNITVTLPPAGPLTDQEIWIKVRSAAAGNTLTVDPDGAETIDGAATHLMTTDFEWVKLRSNGTNWMQVG